MKRDFQEFVEYKKQIQTNFNKILAGIEDRKLREYLEQYSRSDKKKDDEVKNTQAGASILIVDDITYITKTVSYMLQKENFRVYIANSGAEGIAQFVNHLPELVITDIRLPDFNGNILAKLIRKLDKSVPIIFITANDMDPETGLELDLDVKHMDLEANHMAFLPKPIQKEIILETIQHFLEIESKQ